MHVNFRRLATLLETDLLCIFNLYLSLQCFGISGVCHQAQLEE